MDSASGRAGRVGRGEQVPQYSLAFPTGCHPPSSPGMGAYAGPKAERTGDMCGGHRFTWNGSVASAPGLHLLDSP